MEELTPEVKRFILWKDDLKCPFSVCMEWDNGTLKSEEKVSYIKGGKHYCLADVWEFWVENVKPD